MNKFTKKGEYTAQFITYMRNAFNKHMATDCDNIFKAYKRPSKDKIEAFAMCELDSGNLRAKIIAHNTSAFTCSYFDCHGNFVVRTKDNKYTILFKHLLPYI